jgi:hypothetical protein
MYFKSSMAAFGRKPNFQCSNFGSALPRDRYGGLVLLQKTQSIIDELILVLVKRRAMKIIVKTKTPPDSSPGGIREKRN